MTADQFRRLALDCHGAVESAHMGHPDFRVNGRIFATLHSRDTCGMVKLTPEEQDALIRSDPSTFDLSSGAWGRQGCTNVRLATAEPAAVRAALSLAWQQAVDKPKPKPKGSAAKASRPSPRRPVSGRR